MVPGDVGARGAGGGHLGAADSTSAGVAEARRARAVRGVYDGGARPALPRAARVDAPFAGVPLPRRRLTAVDIRRRTTYRKDGPMRFPRQVPGIPRRSAVHELREDIV